MVFGSAGGLSGDRESSGARAPRCHRLLQIPPDLPFVYVQTGSRFHNLIAPNPVEPGTGVAGRAWLRWVFNGPTMLPRAGARPAARPNRRPLSPSLTARGAVRPVFYGRWLSTRWERSCSFAHIATTCGPVRRPAIDESVLEGEVPEEGIEPSRGVNPTGF